MIALSLVCTAFTCSRVIAFTFTVGVDKRKGRPLGMYMNDNKFYGALYVDHVSSDKSTLIGEWNAENPTATIRAGDQVVAVNDKKGCASFLYQQTKALDLLELTVLRNVVFASSVIVHFIPSLHSYAIVGM